MRMRHRHRSADVTSTIRDRGAVLIEMALVALLLIALLAGAFDFGMAWRAGLGVNEAARAGARVGSSVGPDVGADKSIITGMQSTLAASDLLDDVQRVVIYRAQSADGAVPPQCKTGIANNCNVYTGAQFRQIDQSTAVDQNGCLAIGSKGYCPKSRDNVQVSAHYIGIWVRVRYDFQFGFAGTGVDLERTTIMRLEPKDLN